MAVRLGLILLAALLAYGLWRMVLRPVVFKDPKSPGTIMPYCGKCENNRHVVANAGELNDGLRWYCTQCEESF